MLPSSIELRLLEMQRKLSAIAEIPKILSSTLATVSQSFGSLSCEEELYRRKCSYDEDALDYELNEGEEEDEEESSEEEQQPELQLQLEHFKSKCERDGTPESDYASEANYAVNGTHDEQEEEEEEEEEGSEQEEEQLETVYYVRLPAACVAADSDDEARRQQQLESVTDAEDSNSDSDDFLSTSYTWNLRNVPKLRINDATTSVRNLTLSPQLKPETHNAIDISKVRAATPTPTPTPQPEQREAQVTSGQPAAVASASCTSQKVKQSMRRLIRDAYDIVAFAAALQAG